MNSERKQGIIDFVPISHSKSERDTGMADLRLAKSLQHNTSPSLVHETYSRTANAPLVPKKHGAGRETKEKCVSDILAGSIIYVFPVMF